MNKFKKTLIAFLSALCLVCTGLFVVACNNDNEENKPGPAEKYTVTLDYEEEQGTVTLDPAGGKYEKDAQVEVTVTAKEGYAVDAFTVSTDPDAALDELGGYVLTVTANVTITATFKETAQPAPSEFPEEFRGTWNSTGAEDWIVTITKDALTIADSEGNAIAATTTITSVEDFGTTFTTIETVVDETTYTVGVTAHDNVLGFETEIPAEDEDSFPTRATIYFVKDPLPALSFSEDVYGSWTGESLDYPVDIGPNGLTYGISAGTLVYADAESNEYYVIVGGDLYFIMLSEGMLYFGDHMLTQSGAEAPEKTPLNAAFTGTWKDEAGTVTLVVDENGDVTWNGAEATPFNDGMVGIYVDGASYYVNVSATNTLYLAGDTPDTSYTLTKEFDSLTGTELESVIGTWKSYGLDQDYTLTITDSSVTFTVDEEGTATDVPSIFSIVTVIDSGEGYYDEQTYGYLYWFVNGQPKVYVLTPLGSLCLNHESEGDESDEMLWFLPSPLPEITVKSALYGTWIDSEDDTFEPLKIGADGIFWGENKLTILSEDFYESDSYSYYDYYAFCDGTIYEVFYSSDEITFSDIFGLEKELTKKPDDQGGGGQGGEGGGEDVGSTTVPAWLLDTSYLNLNGLGVLSIDEQGNFAWTGFAQVTLVEITDESQGYTIAFTATLKVKVDENAEEETYTLTGGTTSITASAGPDTVEYKFVVTTKNIPTEFRGVWELYDKAVTWTFTDSNATYDDMLCTTFAFQNDTLYVDNTGSIYEFEIFEIEGGKGGNVLVATVSGWSMVFYKQGTTVKGFSTTNTALTNTTWNGVPDDETLESTTITFNADGTVTCEEFTIIVLEWHEKIGADSKTIVMTLAIDSDFVEVEIEVTNGVPGTFEIMIPTCGATYTFTKAAAAQA